jgi:16S rRNA G1207 methylase RsmC
MIELAKLKPGEKAADLGSGDGCIVIALAKAGAGTRLPYKTVCMVRKGDFLTFSYW